MKMVNKIKEVCEKNGVKYYLNYADEWFDNCNWCEYPREFLETLLENNNLENFIFGEKSNFNDIDRDYFYEHEDEYNTDDVITIVSYD